MDKLHHKTDSHTKLNKQLTLLGAIGVKLRELRGIDAKQVKEVSIFALLTPLLPNERSGHL